MSGKEPQTDEATEDENDEEDDEPEEEGESEGDDEPVEDLGSDMFPHFRPEYEVYFQNIKSWDQKWKNEKQRKGVKKVTFGDDFRIQDEHFVALAGAPRAFRRKLLSVKCGNTDNGYGAGLSDNALTKLAEACPSLQNVGLESCTFITDQGLTSLLQHCPGMRTVSVTGHDRGCGRVTSKALNALHKDKTLGAKLLKLHLIDQHLGISACKKLTKKRPALEVVEGITDGDGYASQMVASMGGGGSVTTWKRGKADDEFDSDDDPFGGPRFGAYYGPPRGRGRGRGGSSRGRGGQRGQSRGFYF
ncbi:hypothetical protein PG984_012210 [Apiospora sp. TS-2023a]